MLPLEVPFSKWSHLAYRPLAMYFSLQVRPRGRAARRRSARRARSGGRAA